MTIQDEIRELENRIAILKQCEEERIAEEQAEQAIARLPEYEFDSCQYDDNSDMEEVLYFMEFGDEFPDE